MLQDRNVHRDAQALRKVVSIPLIVPAFGTDQDEPIYISQPRYNWRLSDLSVHTTATGVADMVVKVQSVERTGAIGSPQLSPAAAVTFAHEEFWSKGSGSFANTLFNHAANPTLPFGASGIATVLDGFWGVWLLELDGSANIRVVRQAPIMAFATEEIALANCPRVQPDNPPFQIFGRHSILTINAVGGDFIAGTTNTNAALVAAFNTAPQDGHVALASVATNPRTVNSVLAQALKDASKTPIIQGNSNDSMIVVTVRSDGSPTITGPATVEFEYRPWPAGGEGLGDTSVSQNRPQFVP